LNLVFSFLAFHVFDDLNLIRCWLDNISAKRYENRPMKSTTKRIKLDAGKLVGFKATKPSSGTPDTKVMVGNKTKAMVGNKVGTN
jgi:hypothetical protein